MVAEFEGRIIKRPETSFQDGGRIAFIDQLALATLLAWHSFEQK